MATAKFANKVAIVTGGTAGIGLSIAKRLCRDGASVMISSRKQSNVDKAVSALSSHTAGGEAAGCVCHVGKAVDRQTMVKNTIERFGRIDFLINNAGINPVMGDLMDVNEKTWDKLFDTNVKAGFELSKLATPHIEKNGGGSIIFVSSITGYTPFPIISAYGVTKTALLGLTKAMATSLAHRNIRVNCIAPGIIKTDFSKALWDRDMSNDMTETLIPLGRFGHADDCSGAVSFLCSDDAGYITGEVITITGVLFVVLYTGGQAKTPKGEEFSQREGEWQL